MNNILVATTDMNDVESIMKALGQGYNVLSTHSAKKLVDLIRKEADLLTIDQSFVESAGNEFILGLLARCHLPILFLVPPEGVHSAMEAIRAGATNYLVKTNGYEKTLKLSIDVSIDRYAEQQKMKDVVGTLQKRIEELESAAKKGGGAGGAQNSAEASILDEIVFIFKRGEINLPTPPEISIKFKDMVSSGANIGDIGDLLKKDAAISSKLISISNSAFYRGVAENKTLEQAVGRLGLTTTKRYVDVITNRTLYFTKNKKFAALIEGLWEHSLACAYAAQSVSDLLKLKFPEDAFTLGLLHDIGKLVLFQAVGELQQKKKIGEDIESEELTKTVNTNHGKFGGALLKRWKFANEFVDVGTYHDCLEDADPISKELLVIHFSNLLVKDMGYCLDEDSESQGALEEADSAKFLKVSGEMIEKAKNDVNTQMDELKGYFS